MSRRVVITGLGALTAIGNTTREYWDNLKKGVSGAAPITYFNTEKFRTKFACELKNFDASQFLDRKELKKHDNYSIYAFVVADEAYKDAGLDSDTLDLDRCGVIWGSGVGGLKTLEEEISEYVKGDGTPRYSPFLVPKMIADMAAGNLSIKYGFRGINYATVSACASSTHAIVNAFDAIRLGRADVMICGGSEAAIVETGIGGFGNMKALSSRNDDPSTASRPFDVDRDGFVLGEGAGALILESYEHAVARGAKIYAEVFGGGMTADAYHMTAPHPEGVSVIRVMKNALEDANLKPSDLDYINVHGTSTPLGDKAEIKAITEVFGEHAYKLNISSTKSMTGHLLGAAGAIETIASVMAVVEGVIPPTINHFNNDPEIDNNLNLTLNKAQNKDVQYAMSNTFGFGGKNACVIIGKLK